MRAFIVSALVAALAACSPQTATTETPATTEAAATTETTQALAEMPTWKTARAAGVDFRAIGQEPGWIVDVYTEGRIVALLDYGQTRLEFPRPNPTNPAEGATRYDAQANGHTLSITYRRFACQDAMSGEAYPSAVEVVVDGRTLNGCGRSV